MREAEVDHRIGAAWKKFMTMKSKLCSRHYLLKQRLRLFNATVTATALYGSGTWTMNAHLDRRLRTTQRRMIRWIVQVGRLRKSCSTCGTTPEDIRCDGSSRSTSSSSMEEPSEESQETQENYIDWLKRATGISEMFLKSVGAEDWVDGQKRTDGRWSSKILYWDATGQRSVGRPKRRWEDCINEYFQEIMEGAFWYALAQCRQTWSSLESGFVDRGWRA